MKTIRVAQDFSRYPAGRYVTDGPYSGEFFRKKFLKPALADQEKIVIFLDGARGYGSSFLEEAFGGLVRDGFPKMELIKKLDIQATNQSLRKEILEYIENA
jgi:hypothetical protein